MAPKTSHDRQTIKAQTGTRILAWAFVLERVTGIEPRTISLGIGQIMADEDAEQPTSKTRSSRD
jgi:hypothetical protein